MERFVLRRERSAGKDHRQARMRECDGDCVPVRLWNARASDLRSYGAGGDGLEERRGRAAGGTTGIVELGIADQTFGVSAASYSCKIRDYREAGYPLATQPETERLRERVEGKDD